MLGYLAGVPGRLKTLIDLLSPAWAAKLDALRAGLTDARMGYLDRVDAAISTRATPADVNTRAAATVPTLCAPVASGMTGSNFVSGAGGYSGTPAGVVVGSSTASTSYVTAVSHTGRGVLNFAACRTAGAYAASVRVTIDGVVVGEQASATDVNSIGCIVGAITTQGGIALDQIPYATSLLIEHKSGNSGSLSTAIYKYRKTA